MTFITKAEKQTRALGSRLGRLLRGLDVVCLFGNLGSGKTTFTKGLARGAGFRGKVTSPTFTLGRIYRAKGKTLYHFDLYRVAAGETGDIGIEEYVSDPRGIFIVEWPEAGRSYYPADRLEIRFSHRRGKDLRRISFSAHGSRSRRLLAAIKK